MYVHGMQNLPKHEKYEKKYKPNQLYWGLGVEHETYLQTSFIRTSTIDYMLKHRKQERYSVNYYNAYKTSEFDQILTDISDTNLLVPILVNSHTFQKTDVNLQHKTTYEKQPKPNPKFSSTTVFELLQQHNSYFKDEYDKSFTFDGDTVEFITQDFYNATVEQVMGELKAHETKFIDNLNATIESKPATFGLFGSLAPYKIQERNFGFAHYLTNLSNVSMFNNGTIHVNITLPTMLDASSQIQNPQLFIEHHRNLACLFQWFLPLFIATYGSGDPFEQILKSPSNPPPIAKKHSLFAKGSQRLAVSRYIGVGTYDTTNMEKGKILQVSKTDLETPLSWYDNLYSKTMYSPLTDIGLDINFNKHWSHGLEFRIFDAVSYDELQQILYDIVLLADMSLMLPSLSIPQKNTVWQNMITNAIWKGADTNLSEEEQKLYYDILNLPQQISATQTTPAMPIKEFYNKIMEQIYIHTSTTGICQQYMCKQTPRHIPRFSNKTLMLYDTIYPFYSVSPLVQLTDINMPNINTQSRPQPQHDTIIEIHTPQNNKVQRMAIPQYILHFILYLYINYVKKIYKKIICSKE
jgi:hypothetical protein